jgi:hypothetical protein
MNGKLTAAQKQVLQRMGKADFDQPRFTGNTLEDLLFEWAEIKSRELKASLQNTGFPDKPNFGRASLSLLQSLDPLPIVTRGNDVIARIQANDYYEYIDGGRRRTKKKGDGALKLALQDWITTKGIRPKDPENFKDMTTTEVTSSLAQAIARKIHSKGFAGNKFFSKVINDATFDELGEYLASAMGEKIALSVVQIAKEAKEFKNPFRQP